MPVQAQAPSAPVAAESSFGRLVDDLISRMHAGEAIDWSAIERDYPEHAAGLRAVQPALSAVAELSRSGDPALVGVAATDGGHDGLTTGVLGDFRIVREVGRGGMGIVYEAEQVSLGRRVALKVLPYAAMMDAKQLQRFKNEARAAASLHHEHIVPVYGVGCDRSVHYYAMQLIDGMTLAQVIAAMREGAKVNRDAPAERESKDEGGRMKDESDAKTGSFHPSSVPHPSSFILHPSSFPTAPVAALSTELSGPKNREFYRTIARLIAEAADALEHAHSLGIVHRDVKPGNLMLDQSGKVWVTDFGLARIGPDAGLTMSGDLLGTLRYMAPEQVLSHHGLVDHRADVYGLGCTLYELLTGRPAVDGTERAEVLRKIAFEDSTAPRKLDKAIPAELETITLKTLAKNPNERYATARAMAEDLRRWLDNQTIKAKPPSLRQRASKWGRRHRSVAIMGASSLAVLAMCMAAATGVSVWYSIEAGHARQLAEKQRGRAEEHFELARDVVNEMYLEVAEKWLENEPGMEDLQKRFLLKSLAFYEQFAGEKGTEPTVRRDRGIAFHRVGGIHNKLLQARKAEEAFGQAISVFQLLAEEFPAEPEYRKHLADVHRSLGVMLDRALRFAEAESHLRQAFALFETLVAELPKAVDYRYGQVTALGELAVTLTRAGRYPEAEQAFLQGLPLHEQLLAENTNEYKYHSNLAAMLHNLAMLRSMQNQWAEARPLLERAIQHQERAVQARPREHRWVNSLANHYWQLAMNLKASQQPAEAERAFRQEFVYREKLAGDFPSISEYRFHLAFNRFGLGNLLSRDQEREPAYRQAQELLNELTSKFPDVFKYQHYLGGTLHNLGEVLRRRGEWAEAVRLLEQAIEHQQAALKLNPRDALCRQYLRNHYSSLASYLANSPDLQWRNPGRAVEMANKALNLDPQYGEGHTFLGMAQYRAGDTNAALASLKKGLELSRGGEEDENGALFFLAMAHWQLGDKEQARKSYDQAVGWMAKQPDDAGLRRFRAEATELLGIKDEPKK